MLKQGAPEKCWVQGSLAFDVQNARSLSGTQYTRGDKRATGTAAGCFGETSEARGPSPYLEDRGTQPSYAVVPCMPGIENQPSVSIQTNGNAQQSSHTGCGSRLCPSVPQQNPPAHLPPLPCPCPDPLIASLLTHSRNCPAKEVHAHPSDCNWTVGSEKNSNAQDN